MSNERFRQHLSREFEGIAEAGLRKVEREISSAQGARVTVNGRELLNLCANNYLGLSGDPRLAEEACRGMRDWGFGLSSVRFICGTQSLHRELEQRLSRFLGTEETILYSSCFDANGGLFETLLGPEDAVISDQLNHASIIDGIRLCKAQRYRYANGDLAGLESALREAREARFRLIATDGVFSMDGFVADLAGIRALADRYDALVMVDDSHGVGVLGRSGRGSHEHHGLVGQIDILTGTLGKALGGASGGYVSSCREVVDLLRQRSRPYLFSNSVAPGIVAGSLAALELLESGTSLVERLQANTNHFREAMASTGLRVLPGIHPVVPVMFGEARLAVRVAERMLGEGVYVIPFSFPVVPQGQARIRTQVSAAHTREDLDFAVASFARVAGAL
ncbi:MAG: glycine C-acetyltransferase [Verrucomicrobia bacterium]|nr:MAG: glycine C-acetyltransferase [Verrucomicrobiota bacterium]